jgi:cell fate regulator YaaT (PSP1 superfamily)
MKLIDVEYQFDRNRLTFYFTADGRIDFRAFVRDLAKIFKTRIELWQIGVRDEARRIGGIGSCGRALCCSTWLEKFNKVTLLHAKFQNLPLNPIKLSGQCGRLKCCLLFEMETYIEALKNFPLIDYEIQTDKGTGKIEKFDIFKNYVYVHYGNDICERFTLDEIKKYVPQEAFERSKEIFSHLI